MQRNHHGEHRRAVVNMLHIGSKLMVFWSVFLGLLEFISFWGATQVVSKELDVLAMMITACLFLLSTVGVRAALRLLERNRLAPTPEDSPNDREVALYP
ncbi:MAG: hypothetical protein OWT28_13650 [Firmicutes bacterium]|nr:hypothetical protein [Bacillota bacterium]